MIEGDTAIHPLVVDEIAVSAEPTTPEEAECTSHRNQVTLRAWEIDRHVKSLDKFLDRILAEILRRRPRRQFAVMRPEEDRGCIPVDMRA